MDSKFTKATPPPPIAPAWRSWVRANITAAASPASELWVENQMVKRGWTRLYHNVRVMRVQVDLLMRQPSGLLTLIEVKSQTRSCMAHVAWGQSRRLQRVCAL